MVSALLAKVLGCRSGLPKAANGQPKAPSNPRAAQIGKDMQQGTSKEIARLKCWLDCAVDDGVDPEQASAALLMLVALLHARAKARAARPVQAAIRLEMKAELPLRLAELRLAESPTSRVALQDVLDEATRLDRSLNDVVVTCREQIAAGGVPTRRGHMQLHA